MKRREFLKASGLLCLSTQVPSVLAAQEVGITLESASGGFTLGTSRWARFDPPVLLHYGDWLTVSSDFKEVAIWNKKIGKEELIQIIPGEN